jgi:hypothetical protein
MVVIKAAATSFYARPYPCQASTITTSSTKSMSSYQQHQGQGQDGGRVIRSRLLHRLGIHKKQSSSPSSAEIHCIRNEIKYHTNPLLSPYHAPFLQPLRGESTTSSLHISSNTIATTINKRNNNDKNSAATITDHNNRRPTRRRSSTIRRIRFDDNVLVIPIPSRHKYSNRIKQAYWRDRKEIQEIAEKNRYEYASEGWKWESVFEEDEMYVDPSTGELVHPCWIEEYSNKNEEDEDEEEESDEELYHHDNDDDEEEMDNCEEEEEEKESSSFFDMDRPMLKRGDSVRPTP